MAEKYYHGTTCSYSVLVIDSRFHKLLSILHGDRLTKLSLLKQDADFLLTKTEVKEFGRFVLFA